MDAGDCPPGAEGYEDSVTQKPKVKPAIEKDEKWVAGVRERIKELKLEIQAEDGGGERPMVETVVEETGPPTYLCYPCGVTVKGEILLDSHLLGKKHNSRIMIRRFWPKSIYEQHPYVLLKEKDSDPNKDSGKLIKSAKELTNKPVSELESRFAKYRDNTCFIQEALDEVKAPLLGLEYIIEHPPEKDHHEPRYLCVLCRKQGHPKTIINHITCFWHKYNYINRHFLTASQLLASLTKGHGVSKQHRDATASILTRFAQRVEDKYGRTKPLQIEFFEFEKEKDSIFTWIMKYDHHSEEKGETFVEVIDADLINSLEETPGKKEYDWRNFYDNMKKKFEDEKKETTDPKKERPNTKKKEGRSNSLDSLSDLSLEDAPGTQPTTFKGRRYHPYEPPSRGRPRSPYLGRNPRRAQRYLELSEKKDAITRDHKKNIAKSQRAKITEQANKTLAYHDKHPEKHPLYPEEWKKFWNKRYKEVQAEGKDPTTFDYKPEWIVFWTRRMKELHDAELRAAVEEIYRKLSLTPPPEREREPSPRRREPSPRRREPSPRRREPSPRRRDLSPRRRELSPRRQRIPSPRRREPSPHRTLPYPRHRDPSPRRRELPHRRRLPSPLRREPSPRRPLFPSHSRHSPLRLSPPHRRYSPVHSHRMSPLPRHDSPPPRHESPTPLRTFRPLRSRSPAPRRSPPRRSASPLSRREQQLRNRSPVLTRQSVQTVVISDDELKTDGLSDWDSPSELGSPRNSPRESVRSSTTRGSARGGGAGEVRELALPPRGTDTVISVLRLLVALEEYLGSLGPRVVALLTEALRMEKGAPNASERLLERGEALALLETAKEKLKGATQAGLVGAGALPAARQCVVRVAALLHEADKAASTAQHGTAPHAAAPPDREDIARQMAAALVAQGKTDVSAAELAQLVDAVVAAAEAKRAGGGGGAAGAGGLQLLQAAYTEPAAPPAVPAPAPPDAMDGLSDSDLETLLKNFSELSADEQQSLVAYLRKLEAKDPSRVERLRSFVGDILPNASAATTVAPNTLAATSVPPAPVPAPIVAAPAPFAAPAPVAAPASAAAAATIATAESDDDDYTVEDVVQAATKKVLEEKRKQELECVTRSIETTTAVAPSATALMELIAKAIPANKPTIITPEEQPMVAPAAAPPLGFSQAPMQHLQQQSFNNTPVNTYNNAPQDNYNMPQDQFINPNQQYDNPQSQLNNAQFDSQQMPYNNAQPQFNSGPQPPYNDLQSFNNMPQQYNNPQQQFGNNQQLYMNNPQHGYNDGSTPYNNAPLYNDRQQQSFNDMQPQPFNNSIQPFNNAQQPFNNAQQQHFNNTQQQPFNNAQQPYNNAQQQPYNNMQQQLYNNSQEQPYNNAPQQSKKRVNTNQQPSNFARPPKQPFIQQPNRGGQQPNRGGQQSNRGGQQSNRGGQQSNRGGQQSNRGGQQPNRGGQQSNRGGQQSNRGGQQPNRGGQQPSRGGQQANRGGQQSNRGGQQLNRGGQQPNRGGQQPSQGGQQGNRGGQQNQGPRPNMNNNNQRGRGSGGGGRGTRGGGNMARGRGSGPRFPS